MMSPGFIDIMLGLVFISFTLKGYITGFIRSIVTLVAVIIALGLCTAMPTILSFALQYKFHADMPNYLVANRIAAFMFFFTVAQFIGFLATGLLEKIGLGTADKAVGCVLGIATGVIVGCLPGIAIYQSAAAFNYKPNQKYFTTSFFMKAYHPIVKSVTRPAKAKRKAAAVPRVVT